MINSKCKEAITLVLLISILSLLDVILAKSVDLNHEKTLKNKESDRNEEKYPLELCWEHETFITQTECTQCTPSEKIDLAACKETGNKQTVVCEKSKTRTFMSCPYVGAVETKRFWTFEAASFACALLSNAVVWWRRRSLRYIHYQRVKRQMSDATI